MEKPCDIGTYFGIRSMYFSDACTAMKLVRYRNFVMNLCTLPYFICAIG